MGKYKRTILGTCCVPWNEDGTLAEPIFRRSIRSLIRRGLPDLYVFGTAGEGYAMSEGLFDRVTKVFVEEMADGGAPPMVGIVSLSLRTMIERIERAGKLGVRAYQISFPSWGEVTRAEMLTFFQEVCGRFPDFEFLHYNLPRGRRIATADDYVEVSARHSNLVASKQGHGDLRLMSNLMLKATGVQHFFTEQGFAFCSMIGECGYLISIGAINPARARQYFDAAVRQDGKALFALRAELAAMSAALHASVAGAAHMDGAFDKLFARLDDPEFPLRLLPPYQTTPDAAFERFRDTLRADFPQWLIG